MNCLKCSRACDYFHFPTSADMNVIFNINHAVLEQYMYYCSKCQVAFCGQCCFPKWQALKAEKGLTAFALAASLESDPSALFSESPTCPSCKSEMPYEGPKTDESRCFIVTAACGTELAEDVIQLRAFRDRVLMLTLFGKMLINIYEYISPPLAKIVASSELIRFWTYLLVVRPARYIATLALESKGKFTK